MERGGWLPQGVYRPVLGSLDLTPNLLADCVYVLNVASVDGLAPFLVAFHCTIFIVNLLFCYVLGK